MTLPQREHDLLNVFAQRLIEFPTRNSSDLVRNLALFHTPHTLRRLLWMDMLYRMIIDVPGMIHTYGLRYGQDMVTWMNLRQIHEPDNYYRAVFGFDTFTGHTGSTAQDGSNEFVQDGVFAVPEGYPDWLGEHLDVYREAYPDGSVMVVAGDVRDTVNPTMHPFSPVALAYLDLDLYEPTKHVIETVWPLMRPGAVLAFDEFGARQYPGEGTAVAETLPDAEVRRCPFGPWSYLRKP